MAYSSTVVIKDLSGNNPVFSSGGGIATFPAASTGVIVNSGTICTGGSGGTTLASGVCTAALVQAFSTNTGKIFVGGTGTNAPFSGKGIELAAGAGVELKISNFNLVSCFATVSGEKVGSMGET